MATKKLSEKKKQKLIDITSKIYSRVCKEIGWSREGLMMQQMLLTEDRTISDEKVQEIREEIDRLYCKYLCECDSDLLEDLITGHLFGQIRRAQRTLDIVQKELLERVLNEDNKGDSN